MLSRWDVGIGIAALSHDKLLGTRVYRTKRLNINNTNYYKDTNFEVCYVHDSGGIGV